MKDRFWRILLILGLLVGAWAGCQETKKESRTATFEGPEKKYEVRVESTEKKADR